MNNFDISVVGHPAGFTLLATGPAGNAEDEQDDSIRMDEVLHELLAFLNGMVALNSDVDRLGEILRGFLFPPNIWNLFDKSKDKAAEESGLRIRLFFSRQASDLMQLPWEFCRGDKNFIGLNRRTPIVRFLGTNLSIRKTKLPKPVKILVAIASPSGYPELDVNAEASRITTAMAELENVRLKVVRNITGRDLLTELTSKRGFQPHILHFIGHGEVKEGEGTLLFEAGGHDHRPINLSAKKLSTFLENSICRIVILNACLTASYGTSSALMGVAPVLAYNGLPAVIAMQFPIRDRSAATFASDFYNSLAEGMRLDSAVSQARLYAHTEDDISWGIPVLFTRDPECAVW